MRWLTGLLLVVVAGTASAQLKVDRALVTVEKRNGKDWCVLDVQVSGAVPVSVEALASTVQDYPSYPHWFPHVSQVSWERKDAAVLLSETVVVTALGVKTVNQFTLRLNPATTESGFSLPWVQEKTDGSIDSIEGGWTFEARSSEVKPATLVRYRSRSAVPVVVFGQDLFLRMFLGGETLSAVEAVVDAARRLK